MVEFTDFFHIMKISKVIFVLAFFTVQQSSAFGEVGESLDGWLKFKNCLYQNSSEYWREFRKCLLTDLDDASNELLIVTTGGKSGDYESGGTTTSRPDIRLDSTEVIALNGGNGLEACKSVPMEFPNRINGATGVLLDENKAIICGGYNLQHEVTSECYILTKDGFKNLINMTEGKNYGIAFNCKFKQLVPDQVTSNKHFALSL